MFLKNYQMTFYTFLISGTVMAVSANTWFTAWVGLEINLMSLVPLILISLNASSTEAAVKYFLVQAMASIALIMASLMEMSSLQMYFMMNSNFLILMALSIKAGLAPFHFWFPQVMQIISWAQAFLVLIWQKIAPFALMTHFNNTELIIILIVASAFTGAVGGINQTSFKMILTYSSIAHSSWMLSLCTISISIWASYFFMYSMITITLILLVSSFSIESIHNIQSTKINNPQKIILVMTVLSLAGLPPMLGFTAKLTAILMISKILPIYLIVSLITSSLISLYYYLKLTHTSMMISSQSSSIMKSKLNMTSNMLMTISVFGNFVAPQLVLLT